MSGPNGLDGAEHPGNCSQSAHAFSAVAETIRTSALKSRTRFLKRKPGLGSSKDDGHLQPGQRAASRPGGHRKGNWRHPSECRWGTRRAHGGGEGESGGEDARALARPPLPKRGWVGGSAHARARSRASRLGRARGPGSPAPPLAVSPLPAPAGTVILELSKEKTNERLLDRQAAAFTTSVQHVEAELSAQIRYLTQVGLGAWEGDPTSPGAQPWGMPGRVALFPLAGWGLDRVKSPAGGWASDSVPTEES